MREVYCSLLLYSTDYTSLPPELAACTDVTLLDSPSLVCMDILQTNLYFLLNPHESRHQYSRPIQCMVLQWASFLD